VDTAAEMKRLREEEAAPDAVMAEPEGGGTATGGDDLVVPDVPVALLAQLTGELGFGEARAMRALYHTGTVRRRRRRCGSPVQSLPRQRR